MSETSNENPENRPQRTTRRVQRKKDSSRQPKGRSASEKSFLLRYPIATLFFGLGAMVFIGFWALFGFSGYSGPERWIYIPPQSTYVAVHDSLTANLGEITGGRTYLLWRLQRGTTETAHGMYRVADGDRALGLSRRLKAGRQTPVRLRFNGVRTMPLLASRIARQLEFEPEDFLAACDSVLPPLGFTPEQYPAAFIPDTYETYITASAADVVEMLVGYRNSYWNDSRRARAKELGLTPVGVATIASIVEEESNKTDERPLIARLYLNRFRRGMKLQADPTVKFATGDFGLRRITGKHLTVESPYNTYKHAGLPPGPIRVAERATLDNVLEAPEHDYIYMCAREDFSGYHRFATDYDDHMANARRYQAELNRRNIH